MLNDELMTVASQYYAAATGTFVLASTFMIDQKILDQLGANYLPLDMGHAMVINPNGYIVSEKMPPEKEGIVYADIDLDEIISSKYLIDTAGHYSKPNVCRVTFNKNPQPMITTVGEAPDYFISASELQEV